MARPEDSEIRATYLPAEWTRQSGVQLTWPHEGTDWKPILQEVTDCYVHMALEIAERERLIIVTPEPERVELLLKERLPKRTLSNVSLHRIPTDDTWARDHGFITLKTSTGCLLLDFQFNGWGRKFPAEQDNQISRRMMELGIFQGQYESHLDFVLEGGSIESDGRGTILTTSQCLLAANRNGDYSGEWRVESGERNEFSGEWRVESGERNEFSGEWRVESGERNVLDLQNNTQEESLSSLHSPQSTLHPKNVSSLHSPQSTLHPKNVSSLHSPQSTLHQEIIEERLKRYLRAERVLWLDHGYLAGDDTDCHIDTLARFCPNDTIAYVQCTDTEDEHYEELRLMEEQLQSFRTMEDTPYRLIPLPMAAPTYDADGQRLPATYANFLIINGAVLMPTYRDAERDDKARQQLQQAFPRHEIVPIDCRVLIEQHGSLHCSAMHFPIGALRPIDNK